MSDTSFGTAATQTQPWQAGASTNAGPQDVVTQLKGIVQQLAALVSATNGSGALISGAGAPTQSATQGTLYARTDGSSSTTRLYINTNGGTGWTSVLTST